jgi:hypothetical protein
VRCWFQHCCDGERSDWATVVWQSLRLCSNLLLSGFAGISLGSGRTHRARGSFNAPEDLLVLLVREVRNFVSPLLSCPPPS